MAVGCDVRAHERELLAGRLVKFEEEQQLVVAQLRVALFLGCVGPLGRRQPAVLLHRPHADGDDLAEAGEERGPVADGLAVGVAALAVDQVAAGDLVDAGVLLVIYVFVIFLFLVCASNDAWTPE